MLFFAKTLPRFNKNEYICKQYLNMIKQIDDD